MSTMKPLRQIWVRRNKTMIEILETLEGYFNYGPLEFIVIDHEIIVLNINMSMYHLLYNINNDPRNTILRTAAKYGHLEMIKYLYSQGVDIHVDNDLALQFAVDNGHLETIKYLHSLNANIHVDDNLPLLSAAANGDLEIVKYLHNNGANINAHNYQAIEWAARSGQLEVVEYLHSHYSGQDINIIYVLNDALKSAVDHGHPEMVKYLVNHGANNHNLEFVDEVNRLEITKYLYSQGFNFYTLRYAAMYDDLDALKYFIIHGGNYNNNITLINYLNKYV